MPKQSTLLFSRLPKPSLLATWLHPEDRAQLELNRAAAVCLAVLRLRSSPPTECAPPTIPPVESFTGCSTTSNTNINPSTPRPLPPFLALEAAILAATELTARQELTVAKHGNFLSSALPEAYVHALRALVEASSHSLNAYQHLLLLGPNNINNPIPVDDPLLLEKKITASMRLVLVHMRKICSVTLVASRIVTGQQDLFRILFRCMRFVPSVFHNAVTLVETLVVLHPAPLDLSAHVDLDLLYQLIETLSPLNLSHLCRIISQIVFEPDHCHGEPLRILSSAELLKSRMAHHAAEPSPVDRNHAVILHSNTLIQRLVTLLRLPSLPADQLSLSIFHVAPSDMAENIDPADFLENVNSMFTMNHTTDDDPSISDQPPDNATESRSDAANVASLLAQATEDWDALNRLITQQLVRINSALSNHPGGHSVVTHALVAALVEDSHENLDFSSDYTDFDNLIVPPQLKFLDMSSNQMDVMIIMCSLLGGNRKADAQYALAGAGLVEALEELCGRLDWSHDLAPVPMDGVDCDCSTDAALKIHFLRLLSCFADSDIPFVKNSLFSYAELQLISLCGPSELMQRISSIQGLWNPEGGAQRIGRAVEPAQAHAHSQNQFTVSGYYDDYSASTICPSSLDCGEGADRSPDLSVPSWSTSLPTSQHCDYNNEMDSFPSNKNDREIPMGLASKLVQILVKCPFSKHTLCVSAALESIVRGTGSQAQVLFAQRGLLSALVRVINSRSTAETAATTHLQAQFDLLGELIKRNRHVFAMVNKDTKLYEPLCGMLEVASKNLIDSNVFVRSVFLSLQRFSEEDARASRDHNLHHVPYFFPECHLFRYLQENATRILLDLLYVVDVYSHDSICCLNTALLFLFAGPRHVTAMLDEIERLAAYVGLHSSERYVPISHRLQDLLTFWRQFYIYRPLDVSNLEASSEIPFQQWSDGVNEIESALRMRSRNGV